MRTVHVIGVGAGDPEQVTLQAVRALGELDVVFVVDKGADTDELVDLRRVLCERHISPRPYRVVTAMDPRRDRAASDYPAAVDDWYDRRAELFERMIDEELGPDGCGGFLVWGDPGLYDSTLRVLERVLARGRVRFERHVVPGITSVQALAARHRVTLTGVGQPVHVTTGRRLAGGMPDGLDSVLVMLDGKAAFADLPDADLDIFWGAYLGMPDEVVVAGDLQERKAEILAVREEARARKGWLMDTYLLRRRNGSDPRVTAGDASPGAGNTAAGAGNTAAGAGNTATGAGNTAVPAAAGRRRRASHRLDLDEPGLVAFWTERHLCTLSTPRPDGSPHVVPVGGTLDSEAGLARVITSGSSVKARHVAAGGADGVRVALAQVDGRRWSTVEGLARVVRSGAAVTEAERRYAQRYRVPRPNPERVVLEIAVDRVLGNV